MDNVETKLVKLALRRDPSYPVGVSAPLHCVCRCGRDIKISDPINRCPGCELIVNSAGYILEGDAKVGYVMAMSNEPRPKATCSNNAFLCRTKQVYNHKIYAKALTLVRLSGELAARRYVAQFHKDGVVGY